MQKQGRREVIRWSLVSDNLCFNERVFSMFLCAMGVRGFSNVK